MKHSLKITLILVLLFLTTQLVGLITINNYIKVGWTIEGLQVIEHSATAIGEPPKVENKSYSFAYIAGGILVGTLLLLFMIRWRWRAAWKCWFLLSVILAMAVSFGVYIRYSIAFLAAIILGAWKIYKPNIFIHNFTEIFIYTGIAIIFLPILNLKSVFVLLILISLYDMYAVWKSKHMIKLAKFQAKSHVFAGLFLPYKMGKEKKEKKVQKESIKEIIIEKIRNLKFGKPAEDAEKAEEGYIRDKTEKITMRAKKKMKNAVLGGGDIAFPLLFSGAAMEHLILARNIAKPLALGLTGIISVCAAIALLILLIKAQEDKFYPAMPFVTAGCFIGYGVIWLLL